MFARTTGLAALIFVCHSAGAFAADTVFTGALERVRRQSISVRIEDGRLIDARLPDNSSLSADSIAAKYQLADQVRIGCTEIPAIYDPAASLHLHLGLKTIKLVRRPSPEELARTATALSWRTGENLLRQPDMPLPPWDPSQLEQARAVNLAYAAKLPNFVADETAKRYIARFNSAKWDFQDTIESEIAFNGVRAVRQHIRRNGQPWNQPFGQLPGYLWAVWFGIELRPLFGPNCPTTLAAGGREEIDGRSYLAYRFSSPPNGCFVGFGNRENSDNRLVPARNGRILVEDPGGHMLRFESEAFGFPEDFAWDRSAVGETWDYVKIGSDTSLLPVAAEIVNLSANGIWWKVSVEFANHRHFDASTSIIFH